MSSIRLFVLATLSEHGPVHGYRIVSQARDDRTDLWTDFGVGAVYGVLNRLRDEGLIVEIRTERAGRYPGRTVYALTDTGREALAVEHRSALSIVVNSADPFDLALAHLRHAEPRMLRAIAQDRLVKLQKRLTMLKAQQAEADPWLTPAERLALQHVLARCQTEVDWHHELVAQLPSITAADSESPAGVPT